MKKTYVIILFLFLTLFISGTNIQANTNYQVQSGDTLWEISQKYEIPVRVITRINDINDTTDLKVGQRLIISTSNNQISINIENIEDNYRTHEVEQGDSIWEIAQKYEVPVQELMELNDIDSNFSIYIGQTLKIPENNSTDNTNNDNDNNDQNDHIDYTVQPGDILWNIAQKYDTSVKELVELNNIESSYDLYVGRNLLIPRTETEPEDDNNNDNNNNKSDIPYYFYQVEKDEEIWDIANNFDIKVSELIRFNNISNISDIPEESIIIIPLNKSDRYSYLKNAAIKLNNHYRVRSGETLSDIAEYFEIPEEGLRALNDLSENEEVYTGQKLTMPVSPALFTQHEIYEVESEEYLFDIAFEKGVSIKSILKANYLRNQNQKFEPGEIIIISQDENSQATWIEYEDGEPKNSWFY
ncbi:MAG: LysM peptidoglycan-binding domain-containing protein [Bacillota bacterium]